MTLPFHNALKRYILTAFSSSETSPEEIAAKVCRAMIRPCDAKNAKAFADWLAARDIKRLVHFTALQNVPAITKLGLVPRQYLEMEIVRLAIGSVFSDDQRYDSMPEFNCLSITYPNYKMFYTKRNSKPLPWAVITFDPAVLTRRFFKFTPSNAANSGALASVGVDGAEKLFQLEKIRQKLGLIPCETTDPQAEALCDSIISPEFIMEIFVQSEKEQQWLKKRRINAICDDTLFNPRRDWSFWKQYKRVTDLPEFKQ